MEVIKNEAPETKEIMTIPFEKFPLVTFAKNEISQAKSLIEKLNLKKELTLAKIETEQDVYEKNELEISIIKADVELAQTHTFVLRKEGEINQYIEQTIIPNLKETLTSFNMLIQKAKVVAENDSILKSVVDTLDYKLMEENYDYKINHYMAIKKYLEQKSETAKSEK
jgi:uncharacterized protein YlxP (DUF503 family)